MRKTEEAATAEGQGLRGTGTLGLPGAVGAPRVAVAVAAGARRRRASEAGEQAEPAAAGPGSGEENMAAAA